VLTVTTLFKNKNSKYLLKLNAIFCLYNLGKERGKLQTYNGEKTASTKH
jgi:hypothetical protein